VQNKRKLENLKLIKKLKIPLPKGQATIGRKYFQRMCLKRRFVSRILKLHDKKKTKISTKVG
jgi:hypothetical protein